jgi:hypothetical protein
MKTVAELLAAYPYMFNGSNIGLALYRGWYPTFAKLCDDIDALLGEDKRNFKFVQLKSKFGAARWYARYDLREGESRGIQIAVQQEDGSLLQLDPNLNAATIEGLINLAQDETSQLCIVCGESAKIESHRGYYQCLCKKHTNKVFGGGKLPKYWFEIGGEGDPNDPWGEHGK